MEERKNTAPAMHVTGFDVEQHAAQATAEYVQWLQAGNSTGHLSEHAVRGLQKHFADVIRALPAPQLHSVASPIKRYDEHPDGGGMREDELEMRIMALQEERLRAFIKYLQDNLDTPPPQPREAQ